MIPAEVVNYDRVKYESTYHEETKLTRRKEISDPVFNVLLLYRESRRNDTTLVESSNELNDNLSRTMIINDFEFANVSFLCKQLFFLLEKEEREMWLLFKTVHSTAIRNGRRKKESLISEGLKDTCPREQDPVMTSDSKCPSRKRDPYHVFASQRETWQWPLMRVGWGPDVFHAFQHWQCSWDSQQGQRLSFGKDQ